jgi:crossover junction endodeoxyribonuclease RuvC
MRVLGIDPSLTSTGVAVIDGAALIRARTFRIQTAPPKRAKGDKTPPTLAERRARLRDIRGAVLDWAFTGATALTVIEGPSYSSAGAGTWDRAWLWGSLVDALHARDIPVALAPPKTVKLWATGRGDAGKTAMSVHLSRMWPETDPHISEDEWDALAMASIAAQRLGWLPTDLTRHRDQLEKVAWPEVIAA